MTIAFDGNGLYTEGGVTYLHGTTLYVGAELYELYDLSTYKSYIVVNVESDWTAQVEEVTE